MGLLLLTLLVLVGSLVLAQPWLVRWAENYLGKSDGAPDKEKERRRRNQSFHSEVRDLVQRSRDLAEEFPRPAEEFPRPRGETPQDRWSWRIRFGPRGGRYTEETTKDGRPYRRYF